MWITKECRLFSGQVCAIPAMCECAVVQSRAPHLCTNPRCLEKRGLSWGGGSEPWILLSVFAHQCNVLFPLPSLQRYPGLHLSIVLSSRTWQVERNWAHFELPPNWVFFHQHHPLDRSQQRWASIATPSPRPTFFIPLRIQFLSE